MLRTPQLFSKQAELVELGEFFLVLIHHGYTIIDRATGTVGVPLATRGMITMPQYNLAIECK